jgi:hypothetical protein
VTSARGLARALNALGPVKSFTVVVAVSLAMLWLAVAVMYGVVPVRAPLINRLGGVSAGDFMYFYPAGVLAADGRADQVYDLEPMTTVARTRLRPDTPDLVWPYPPTMSLVLAPLGWLTPRAALWAWLGLTTAAMFLLGRLTLGSWSLTPAVLLFPGSALALFTGQFSPVLSALLGLMFLTLDESPTLAGIALGLLALKPQFGVAPGLSVLFGQRWRIAAVAVMTGLLVIGLSVVAFGLLPWTRFVALVLRHAQALDVETPMSRFVSPFATFQTCGVSLQAALGLHAIVSVPVAAAAWQVLRSAAPPSRRAFGLTSATLLISPYALDYDLMFLLLPWCLAIREACDNPDEARTSFWFWLGLTVLVPVSYMTQLYTHISVCAPALIGILGATWWRYGRGTRLRRATQTGHARAGVQ